MLKFSKGNAKLDGNKKVIYTFSLPAGWTCPGALDCKSKVVVKDDKRRIKDGKDTKFRCFAASQEVLYTNTYKQRQFNIAALRSARSTPAKFRLISHSLPKKAEYVRIHVSGDFFSKGYFAAWILVAAAHPNVIFYAYTKSLNYWVDRINDIPSNLILTASYGGRYDSLIDLHGLRSAKVFFSEEAADNAGLVIDHDDSLAMARGSSFALLLHGTQPKGTEAAKSWYKIKTTVGGYSRKKLKMAKAK